MSDNEDEGFQELGDQYEQILEADDAYQSPQIKYNPPYGQKNQAIPTQSTIRYRKNFQQQIYKVKIQQGESQIDIKILQSQFYILKLYERQKLIRDKLKRRYSDFDMLFELLQKRHPGYVFPAFPEKGILSYVKTKVSVAKDEKLVKTRIKTIERFLNKILNDEKFNPEKCLEIKKFFSPEAGFELFKKTAKEEISQSKSIVDSTWGMIKDFFKMSQTTKYTAMIEEIKSDKLPFEELLSKTQEFSTLITDELQANDILCQEDTKTQQTMLKFVPTFYELRKMAVNYSEELTPISQELIDLQFNLECQNEDYLMVLKKIEFIEQMKQSEQNYKNLASIESQFAEKCHELKDIKKERIEKLKQKFKDIVERINEIEREKS